MTLARLRRAIFAAICAMVLTISSTSVSTLGSEAVHAATPTPFRAFRADSWWNSVVPARAPSHADFETILSYLRTAEQNGGGFLRLAGAGKSRWGQPIFWSERGDREYRVVKTRYALPREFSRLRIPAPARPGDNSDAELVIYDRDRGYVALLWRAAYNARTDTWSAGGGSVAYLDSNGLHATWAASDDPRNTGSFRGNSGATVAVRYDEVTAGAIEHVLKIAAGPEVSTRAVFPLIRSDGDDPASPVKQGLRLRIKPSVNLKSLRLHPQALVIARAIKRYGVYVGDSAGVTALKLEDTRVHGRGQLWTLPVDALSQLPFTPEIWQVLPDGYKPSIEPDAISPDEAVQVGTGSGRLVAQAPSGACNPTG